MKKKTVGALVRAAAQIGEEAHAYEGYCGRGMLRNTTDAVVIISLSNFFAVVAQAGAIAGHEGGLEELIQDLGRALIDNLGRDFVVY